MWPVAAWFVLDSDYQRWADAGEPLGEGLTVVPAVVPAEVPAATLEGPAGPSAYQAMPRALPCQNGSRSRVFNTLPAPDSGSASTKATLRGHL